jgi:5'(3')-deoxyribonucleotidase
MPLTALLILRLIEVDMSTVDVIDRIFFDMDGLITDFRQAAIDLHNLHEQSKSWPKGVWDFHVYSGLSGNAFFAPMEDEFWENLPLLGDGFELLRMAEAKVGTNNVCLLTAPTLNYGCHPGKIKWLEKNLPAYRHRVFIGSPKEMCGFPGSLLIDDSPKNIDKFSNRKRFWHGYGILVPRPWNTLYEIAERGETVDYVRAELEKFMRLPELGMKLKPREHLREWPESTAEISGYDRSTQTWNIWMDGNFSTWVTVAELHRDFEVVP